MPYITCYGSQSGFYVLALCLLKEVMEDTSELLTGEFGFEGHLGSHAILIMVTSGLSHDITLDMAIPELW